LRLMITRDCRKIAKRKKLEQDPVVQGEDGAAVLPLRGNLTDSNGVIIELPAATAAETNLTGSLVFGIGTQSNNGLGNATVYTVDNNGNFATSFKGTSYPGSFLDSGSNGIFFLNSNITGITSCTNATGFYCPGSPTSVTATTNGQNGASATIKFSVGNAETLFANSADSVFPSLAGPGSNDFDWGLPFFFGRNVFTAIEGANTPGGVGPYWAY